MQNTPLSSALTSPGGWSSCKFAAMDAGELSSIITKDLHLSLKVDRIYAVDTLPDTISLKPSHGLIANVDVWGQAGIYWVCCFDSRSGGFEFFDAAGKPSHYYSRRFNDCLNDNVKGILYNGKALQPTDSNMCGAYVLYYLYYRCRGYKMLHIISHFSNQGVINDLIVKTFIQNIE